MTFYQRQLALLKDLEQERQAEQPGSYWHDVLGRKITALLRAMNDTN